MTKKVTSEKPLGIKSLAKEDRPREKMLAKGVGALSDAELIAIIIGSGNANESAVSLSQKMLSAYRNDLNRFAQATCRELMANFCGIGEAKAVSVMAALELGRRRRASSAKESSIVCSADMFARFCTCSDLRYEEFWVMYLDTKNRAIALERIGQGGFDRTAVDVRLLMQKALLCSASAVAVCHNHPSGDLTPSLQDKALTKQIKDACGLMSIRFLDHLIVSGTEYFSFADEGIL